MKNNPSKQRLAMALSAMLLASPAFAGFSIAVKPLKAAQAPAVASTGVVATPVATPEVKSTQAASVVTLQVGRGASLQEVVKQFLSPFGWTPAWMAGEVVAGDAMEFQGVNHEEALANFLKHYSLVGERFEAEKGYVIRRAGTAKDKAGAAK